MYWLRALVSGVVARVMGATTVVLALDGPGGQVAAHPQFPTMSAMSTLARFPWVWCCVRAVASDLAGLPIVAAVETRDDNGQVRRKLVDDPALRLLRQPGGGMTAHLFRKQVLVDYLLTGNAFIWRPSAIELIRLHPAHVEPRAASARPGAPIVEYKVWDGSEWFSVLPSAMLHIRDVSWSADVSSLLGESPIRCLQDDLSMELGAKQLAAHQASKGRPEILLSTDANLGPTGADELVKRWETATKSRHGAFATGRGVKATPLGWSPREFEFAARSEVARDVVLAVFEVPPARAGLSAANFGTDKNQLRVYWESLRRRAQAFDDAWTTLAAPGVRIEHDFSDVEALQVSFTERITQATMLVGMGATPRDAMDYVGFDEAPVPDVQMVDQFHSPRPIDRQPENPNPQSARSMVEGVVTAYLLGSVSVYAQLGEAVRGGADASLALRIEAERLFALLDRHLGHADARWWAEEIAAGTLEAVRIAEPGVDVSQLEAFAPTRARRLAERMHRREAA